MGHNQLRPRGPFKPLEAKITHILKVLPACQGPGLSVLTSPATKNSRGASSSLALYLAMIFSAIGWISCLAASDSPSSSESVTREERTRNSGLSTSGTWDDPRAGPGPHWARRHRQALGTGPSPPASTQVELSQSYPGSCAAPTPSPELFSQSQKENRDRSKQARTRSPLQLW